MNGAITGQTETVASVFCHRHALITTARGFTLLEMLLVVLILGALAFTATAFVENGDGQLRYEDTRTRLALIRRAVVGEAAPVYGGQMVVSGYVVENGVLPEAINVLIDTNPGSLAANSPKNPVFDPDPDITTGLNNTTGSADIPLMAANETLEKGWRAGYLRAAPGSSGVFRDGWGTLGAAPNYGWGFDVSIPDRRTITSLGKDGVVGGATAYNADMIDTISTADWSSSITNLTVRVKAAIDIPGGSGSPYLGASLLVFVNDTSGGFASGRWRRYSTSTINTSSGFDGTGDRQCDHDGSPATPEQFCPPGEWTLTFPAHPWSHRVPIGRHLLVLTRDNNTTAHDGGAGETLYTTTMNITHPLVCYPAGCPIETLVIR